VKPIPTIEQQFARYVTGYLSAVIDPIAEDEQRTAFFCGFEACLRTVDILAEVTFNNEAAGENAWQQLAAEFERFAQASAEGENTINNRFTHTIDGGEKNENHEKDSEEKSDKEKSSKEDTR